MTQLIFASWARKFNNYIRLRNPDRRVLLLVDNCSGHLGEIDGLTNVSIKFLPPNTTSHLQPCDAGIIKTMKTFYRKRLVNSLYESVEYNNEIILPDVKKAIHMLVKAWNDVCIFIITFI